MDGKLEDKTTNLPKVCLFIYNVQMSNWSLKKKHYFPDRSCQFHLFPPTISITNWRRGGQGLRVKHQNEGENLNDFRISMTKAQLKPLKQF